MSRKCLLPLSILTAALIALGFWLVRLPAALQPDRADVTTYVIENVTLLDPATGELQTDGHVRIDDGWIAGVGTGPLPPGHDGLPRMDADGLTLMPGLIDMHVHVFDPVDLGANLSHGVTTVRNMGGMPFHQPLARRIEQGEILGPRLLTTGPILNETGGRNSNLLHDSVSGADEARDAVRRQYTAGFRDLKLYSNLSRESFEAIRAEAARLGMTMSGHPVEGTETDPLSILTTLGAGFVTIEHTESIVWHGLEDDRDPDRAWILAQRMAASGVTVDPTLVVHENLTRIVETRGAHLTRPDMQGYNPVVASFEQDGFDFWSTYQGTDRTEMQAFYIAFTGMMHQAGVRLTVGTDAGVMATPHGVSTVREMELLVEAGLTPLEAIRAATLNPADALGMGGEIGCLDVGCAADFLLVDGDPRHSIGLLYHPQAVVREGRWLDRADLDALDAAGRQPSQIRTWWHLARHLWSIR